MTDHALVERIWLGEDAGARAARGAMAPLALLYRGAVAARGALYDTGALRARDAALPTVSVGNLSVGGTGKTPVAAWVARELAARGARPAIVLRGYGGDEPLVHERLNPGVPVVAGADRVEGIALAAAGGADVAVLDDAFQHRRVRRDADIVLLSADAWTGSARLLPAGPWREPLRALRRATLVLVTRKAAPDARVAAVEEAARRAAPGVPVAVARLELGALRRADEGEEMALAGIAGRDVLAIAAVGNPRAFAAQLAAAGARVRARAFPDHHPFTAGEGAALAAALRPSEIAVCTLKDAVKLAPLWPASAPPLWYVSQHLALERGRDDVAAVLDRVLRARGSHSPIPAGASGS
jgi:tetraacyldisaccharide 4'-kinase